MTGMLKSTGPSAPMAVNVDAFEVQRKAAQDAVFAHRRMVSNEKALVAQLGPQGYAKALALARQQADAASVAMLSTSGFTG